MDLIKKIANSVFISVEYLEFVSIRCDLWKTNTTAAIVMQGLSLLFAVI